MLRIRQEQMDAFSAAALQAYYRELRDDLNTYWPAYTATHEPDALLDAITHAATRIEAHGLTTQRTIARYINAAFALNHGRSFDLHDHPEARAILGRRDLTQDEKADLFVIYVENRLDVGEG